VKNTVKLLRIIAITALIGFSFSSCGGGSGSPAAPSEPESAIYEGVGDDGNTYKLVITDNAGRAVLQYKPGDTYTYVLTINFGDKTSEGTVTVEVNGVLKLTPRSSEITFTITVSLDGNITEMSGTIVTDKGNVPAPRSVQPVNTDPDKIRLYGIPVMFYDETSETDFGYGNYSRPMSDFITGTPKAEITGTGADRKFNVEFDTPKPSEMWSLGILGNPSDAKMGGVGNAFFDSAYSYVINLRTGNRYMYKAFVDKDVTLNGTLFGDLICLNIKLKKGWNYLVYNWNSNTQSGNITAVYQTLPAGTIAVVGSFSDPIYDSDPIRLEDIPVTRATSGDFSYQWNGNPLSDYLTGTPKATITNGKLTIEFDAPKYSATWQFTGIITTTPASARFFEIPTLTNSDVSQRLWCYYDSKQLLFWYASEDAIVNGISTGEHIYKYESVEFKKGWNYLTLTVSGNTFTYTKVETLQRDKISVDVYDE